MTLFLGFWLLLLSFASVSSRFSCPVYLKEKKKKAFLLWVVAGLHVWVEAVDRQMCASTKCFVINVPAL